MPTEAVIVSDNGPIIIVVRTKSLQVVQEVEPSGELVHLTGDLRQPEEVPSLMDLRMEPLAPAVIPMETG